MPLSAIPPPRYTHIKQKKTNNKINKKALIIQFAPKICAHKCIYLVNTIFLLGGKYKTDFVHLHICGSYDI